MMASKLADHDVIDSPLTREEIADRLDALFGTEEGALWKRLVPPAMVYTGSHDLAGFVIERARTTSDAAVKLRGRYEATGDRTRVRIETVRDSMRSTLMWCIGSVVAVVGIIIIVMSWVQMESVLSSVVTSAIALAICAALIAIIRLGAGGESARDRLFLERLLMLTEAEGIAEGDRLAMLDAGTVSSKRFTRHIGAFTVRTQLDPEEVARRIHVLLGGNQTYSAVGSVYKPQYVGLCSNSGFRILQVRKFIRQVQLDGAIRSDGGSTVITVECRGRGWSIASIGQLLGIAVLVTNMLVGIRFPDLSIAVTILAALIQVGMRPSELRSRMRQEQAFLEKVLDAPSAKTQKKGGVSRSPARFA